MNVDQKIKELESQVSLVQKELESLKNYVHNSKEIAANENTGFINENNITARPQSKLQQSSEQSTLQNPEQSSQQNSQKERVSLKTSSSSNVESILGKYFMGIAASVLIFTALILFGVLIYRNFTDVMKLIAIYGISTALLLSGCLMLRKKRNAFLLSLTGCGLGAFYTSMILTYTYFHRINDITLYFMLVAWTIAVIFIARQYHAMMISIIGQCGILIASLFGLSVVDSDAGFLLLSIFIVVSTSMFLLLECSIYKQRMQCFFILTDAFLLFITGIFRIFARGHHIPLIVNTTAVILLAYSFFLFLFFIRKVLKQSVGTVLIFTISTFFLILANIFYMYNLRGNILSMDSKSVILIVWFFIWWIAASFFKIKGHARVSAFVLIYLFMLIIYQMFIREINNIAGLSLFYLPFLLIGTWKKDMMYKIGGYVTLGFQLVAFYGIPAEFLPVVIITGCSLVLAGVILYLDKNHYSVNLRLTHYFYLIAFLVFTSIKLVHSHYSDGLPEMTLPICVFFAGSVMTVLMLFLGWCKNPNTGENEKLMSGILNKAVQLFLAYGITICYSDRITVIMHLVMILWLTVLCSYGFKNFVAKIGMQKGSVLLAIKYTVYIILILHSFTIQIQTITSIVCLLIAISCILLGFRLEAKYLRFYGLALTMIAIAKLLLIDISYTDSIARIVSFFICGLLCFLINFIYSIAVKKYEK